MREQTLDEKLCIIEDAITDRLGKSAMSDTSYSFFLQWQLYSQGLLGPLYNIVNNGRTAGQYSAMFQQKIPTKQVKGLKRDYEALESTTLSPGVQDDVNNFQKLQSELGEYLKGVIGDQPVSKKYYMLQINLFTLKYLWNNRKIMGIFRFAYLIGGLSEHYSKDFNIISKQENVGPVPYEQVSKAMQKKQ